MFEPFSNQQIKKRLEQFLEKLGTATKYYRADKQIVFVCGGADSIEECKYTARQKFIIWAENNMPDTTFVYSEAAARDLNSYNVPSKLNLSNFEKLIADLADCTLVFAESVGSFAETGYFSAFVEISNKCLMISDVAHQKPSFILNGPMRTINDVSMFGATIFMAAGQEHIAFDAIKERILEHKKSNRSKIVFGKFDELTGGQQLAVIHYFISIFPTINFEGIKQLFKVLFKSYSQRRIKETLSILVATKYVQRSNTNTELFLKKNQAEPLIEVTGIDVDELHLEFFDDFKKFYPEYVVPRKVVS